MASEFKYRLTIEYDDGEEEYSKNFGEVIADAALKILHVSKQTVGTVEELVDIGDAGAGCWLIAINHDDANYVQIRVGTGGSDFAKLLPGKVMGPVPLDPTDAAAPYAIANTAACRCTFICVSL